MTVDARQRRVIIVLVTALVCLWGARFGQNLAHDSWSHLTRMCFWAGTQIVFYLVVPLVVTQLAGGHRHDIGWRIRGTSQHARTYLALFAIGAPFVVAASWFTEFQNRYPLFDVVPGQTGVWGDLAVWWVFYALQFVAVETFFRGFLVLGLAEVLGSTAVLVATVPYLMIHFVKPPLEAAASIVGGIVMGALALRSRSIWWGVALHVAIAALMDVMSLGHKGFLW
ncbi:MAG: hypothetical protein RIS33_925 [Actinomycetota bacterium]